MDKQLNFADLGPTPGTCSCQRCGAPCKVDPIAGSKATMLKRSARPEGLCINCAVHDALRHLYPANLILARSGPKGLALPHIQKQFYAIAKSAITDAQEEEINWQAIIANWELPFPTKIKRLATNPVTQEEMDRERLEGERQRQEGWKPPLSEQERRAKEKARIEHAARELINTINPEGPPIKQVHIDEYDTGLPTGTIRIKREHGQDS